MKHRRRGVVLGLALLILTPGPMAGETLGDVYRRVSSAVVVVRARGEEVTAEGTAGFRELGSGVLISPDGKIATAAHVVHVMRDITVEFLGEEPVPARVISSEPRADISLLQVAVVPRDARPAALADSDQIKIGDPVFVVGAPYGLRHSLSAGIISARWEPDTVSRDFPLAEFFQTDATINTGNSGGPLFSQTGDLIGIVSYNITKSGGSEGLGFAVTTNTVRRLLLERRRAWYGLELVLLTGPAAEALNVPQAGGFLIKQVAPDSPAAQLGLRGGDRVGIVAGHQMVVGGDILLAVQGITVASDADMDRVVQALEALEPGGDIHVTVLRGDRVEHLSTKWTEP